MAQDPEQPIRVKIGKTVPLQDSPNVTSIDGSRKADADYVPPDGVVWSLAIDFFSKAQDSDVRSNVQLGYAVANAVMSVDDQIVGIRQNLRRENAFSSSGAIAEEYRIQYGKIVSKLPENLHAAFDFLTGPVPDREDVHRDSEADDFAVLNENFRENQRFFYRFLSGYRFGMHGKYFFFTKNFY